MLRLSDIVNNLDSEHYVIACRTEDEAKALLAACHEMGMTWWGNRKESLIDTTRFNDANSCYIIVQEENKAKPSIQNGSLDLLWKNRQIIKFCDLIIDEHYKPANTYSTVPKVRQYRAKKVGTPVPAGSWMYGQIVHGLPSYLESLQSQPKSDSYWMINTDSASVIMEEINFASISIETGHYDRKHKLIFDGDVVRTKYGRLCKVVTKDDNTHAGFDLKPLESNHTAPDANDLWHPDNLLIMGNIFENDVNTLIEVNEEMDTSDVIV